MILLSIRLQLPVDNDDQQSDNDLSQNVVSPKFHKNKVKVKMVVMIINTNNTDKLLKSK